MNIVNLSDFPTEWCWLRDEFHGKAQHDWFHYSSQSIQLPTFLPKKDSLSRFLAAGLAVKKSFSEHALLVSHGPRPAMYAGIIAQKMRGDFSHLVYSFNFTDLPVGRQHSIMTKAYRHAKRFVVFSSIEREIYANYFEIPITSIDMLHWAVHPPKIDLNSPPLEQGEYICALGSQARDYATLFEAMRLIPRIKLVVVANQESIKHLSPPDNVKIYTDIPLASAHNILAHSKIMIVPLRDSVVPCGHVTIVSAMFFQKPLIVTDSLGVHDYIKHNKTGILCLPRAHRDLAEKIELLWHSPSLQETLSEKAYRFAMTHCTQQQVVNYLDSFITGLDSV